MLLIILLFATLHQCYCKTVPSRSFGYQNNTFLLDGKPFRFIAGSIHYFRIHPALWDDRLKRVRAAGLNAIQFYIPWNFHEVEKGRYNFVGSRNVIKFIKLAAKRKLKVFLRVGPYINGQVEFGGLPWWLLLDKNIKLRTSDASFTSEVKRWFEKLLPLIVPFLHRNGGPILMVQVENEYGIYSDCDHAYTEFLRDLIQSKLGKDVLLYTADPSGEETLKCGSIPGVMATINSGPESNLKFDEYFALQRKYAPDAPYVDTEFYTGWFSRWGDQSQEQTDEADVIASASYIYQLNASFSLFLIHGGTNFAFWNGIEMSLPVTTSYDFTAPITEAGDLTSKFHAIRNWISSLEDWPTPPTQMPLNNSKIAIEKIQLNYIGTVDSFFLDNRFARKNCISSKYPLSFEQLRHPFGFVIYSTKLKFSGSDLSIPSLKDLGFTSVDGEPQGVFVANFRNTKRQTLTLRDAKRGSRLSIVVENYGREEYTVYNDFKGILSNVTLDGKTVDEWTQCGVDLKIIYDTLRKPSTLTKFLNVSKKSRGPGIYFGSFTASQRADSFFDSTGWDKGVLIVNGENLGRYWPSMGPQITLYVPSPIFQYRNYLLLFELGTPTKRCDQNCSVEFLDYPIFKTGISNTI